MNIAMLLTPKSEVKHIEIDSTLRQALESMQHNGYTSVPVLSDTGKYVGTLTEGDLLWTLKTEDGFDETKMSTVWLEDITMKIYNEPMDINTSMEKIIKMSINQNFIPVVDDNKVFIGIVKRGDIISYCMKEFIKCEPNIDILTPKNKVIHISENTPIEKALEIMQKYRFSALPVIDEKDRYTETLTEGDLLWSLKTDNGIDESELYKLKLVDIAMKVSNKPAQLGYSFKTIVDLLERQNFVPIIDDNGIFKGIVKRSDVMSYFVDKLIENRGK